MPETKMTNGYSNGNHHNGSEMEDNVSFLFTSESVGEGHPGERHRLPCDSILSHFMATAKKCGGRRRQVVTKCGKGVVISASCLRKFIITAFFLSAQFIARLGCVSLRKSLKFLAPTRNHVLFRKKLLRLRNEAMSVGLTRVRLITRHSG